MSDRSVAALTVKFQLRGSEFSHFLWADFSRLVLITCSAPVTNWTQVARPGRAGPRLAGHIDVPVRLKVKLVTGPGLVGSVLVWLTIYSPPK